MSPIPSNNGTVLVVDDVPLNRYILCHMLHTAGFRTQQAENGADALDTLSSSPPGHFAAMVTDLCMPVLNGYDTVRAIRASELVHGTRLPVICCTSEELDACSSMHPEETVLQHGMLCGFDEIVTKPPSPSVMKMMLHKHMGDVGSTSALAAEC